MNSEQLSRVLRALHAEWQARFPDIGWRHDPLRVNLAGRPVERLRLALQEKTAFHLRHVSFVTSDGPAAGDQRFLESARITTSSVLPGTESSLTDRLLLKPDNVSLGFHTLEEEGPWVEIAFQAPVRIESISLGNRSDDLFYRARTLKVTCYSGGGGWETAYDGVERTKIFSAWIYERSRELLDQPDDDLCKAIQAILPALLQSNLEAAQKAFASSKALQAVKQELNLFAVRSDRLFTIHALRRAFQFWSVDEKRRYVEFSNDIARALEEISEFVCFGFGLALGIARAGDLIPHDDDIDVIVAFKKSEVPTIADALELVEKHMSSLGYLVAGKYPSHRHVYAKGMNAVDVFIGLIEGDDVSGFPSRRRLLPRTVIFPPARLDFLGIKLPVPADMEEYLRLTYGPTWRIPDQAFGHPWKWSEYGDIAGRQRDQ